MNYTVGEIIDGRLVTVCGMVFDGAPRVRGLTVYVAGHGAMTAISKMAKPGDFGWGPRPGAISGIRFKIGDKRGSTSCVLPVSSWGVTQSIKASAASLELDDIESECNYEGYDFAATATRVAARITGRHIKGMDIKVRQTRPQFRAMSHAAVNPGAMVCISGGSHSRTLAIDRSEAYLNCLRVPVPVPMSWRTVSGDIPVYCDGGFVEATVFVPPDGFNNMPPLPVRVRAFIVYPTGLCRGTWTIDHLRYAVSLGCEVREVHNLCVCELKPWLEPVYREVAGIKYKPLRKAIYTRLWGRLASMGGYRFSVVDAFRGRYRLKWEYSGKGQDDWKMRNDYRPDAAAYIASSNSVQLNKSAEVCDEGSVSGLHVDALWTTDTGALEKINAIDNLTFWKVKKDGPVRHFGVGMRDHDGEIAAMGLGGTLPTRAELEAHAKSGRGTGYGTDLVRDWAGVRPVDSIEASSVPLHGVRPLGDPLRGYGPDAVGDNGLSRWTPGGWLDRG